MPGIEDKSKLLIVVTGASAGIGKQIVRDFAARGYPVLALARRVESMDDLKASNVLIEKADVTVADELKAAVEKAESHFGVPVDCMINNAGVMYLDKFEQQQLDRLDNMIATNVNGLVYGTHLVSEPMIKRKHGTIINISSIAGKKGFPNHQVYCGTKFFVGGFSETLREELAPHNVRVICIEPGACTSELLSHNRADIISGYEDWKNSAMEGIVLDPVDVSNAVIFAYEMPQHVNVREIALAATKQPG